jgi:hypothetical protein
MAEDNSMFAIRADYAINLSTVRKLTISCAMVATLFCASVRLPAAPCIVTNTPGPKACEPGCCKNKTCCETSHERTGPASQPLAKAGLDQQTLVPLAVLVSTPSLLSLPNEKQVVCYAEPTAHSPPLLPLLCTLLI